MSMITPETKKCSDSYGGRGMVICSSKMRNNSWNMCPSLQILLNMYMQALSPHYDSVGVLCQEWDINMQDFSHSLII